MFLSVTFCSVGCFLYVESSTLRSCSSRLYALLLRSKPRSLLLSSSPSRLHGYLTYCMAHSGAGITHARCFCVLLPVPTLLSPKNHLLDDSSVSFMYFSPDRFLTCNFFPGLRTPVTDSKTPPHRFPRGSGSRTTYFRPYHDIPQTFDLRPRADRTRAPKELWGPSVQPVPLHHRRND